MFNHYRTLGFIIKKTDRGEFDRIFTVYTKDFGKLELLAKAERKITSKLRSGLELFYLSEIEFIQGKSYKTLTGAVLVNDFKNLKKDLKILGILYKISEVSDALIKEAEPDNKIWNLLNEVFEKLEKVKPEIVYYYFFWNFLSIFGYHPEMHFCSLCRKKLSPEGIFFDLKEGGLVCSQCGKLKDKPANKIDSDAIKIIRIILKKDWSTLKKLKIEKEELESLKAVSQHYFSGLLETVS